MVMSWCLYVQEEQTTCDVFRSSGGEKDGSRRVPPGTTTFGLFLALGSTFLLIYVLLSLATNSLGS